MRTVPGHALGVQRPRPGRRPRAVRAAHRGCDRRVARALGARELTGRGSARVRRVARTLADLDDRAEIDATDLATAGLLRADLELP